MTFMLSYTSLLSSRLLFDVQSPNTNQNSHAKNRQDQQRPPLHLRVTSSTEKKYQKNVQTHMYETENSCSPIH
jgi:hypothetical protein